MTVDTTRARAGWRAIPAGIWALGFVSMFMDISSEMIHALLPVYMVTVLGTSALAVGAFLGPLIAIGLMWLTADHFTSVFWIAVIPAFLSFALIIIAVREPERPKDLRIVRMPLSRGELSQLSRAYWWVVTIAAVFSLARFSEAFLVLRAQSIGMPLMLV